MPYIGNQPGTGVRSRFIYTATASQTTFSGADNNSKTLKYADSDYIDVYLNGVCLVPGTDYTASTKTSVVLTQAASLSDTLEVVAYDIATMADTVSKADGGTFEDGITIRTADNTTQLTLESTDADANSGPVLDLYRNSASPADSDQLGKIEFIGRNDNSQDVTYIGFEGYTTDVTDGTEDGFLELKTIVAGSPRSRMMLSSSEVVFNDNSVDSDFRVESDGEANMFHVDGAANSIGIGETGLAAYSTAWGTVNDTRQVSIKGSNYGVLHLKGDVGTDAHWSLGAGDAKLFGAYDSIGNQHHVTYIASSSTVFNDDSCNLDFRVEGDNQAACLFVDASADSVMIGTSSGAVNKFTFNELETADNYAWFGHGDSNVNSPPLYINRQASDGSLIQFLHASTAEGSISVSGSTVVLNGFSGRHESSGIPTNTPVGTVVSTIDELDVYPDKTTDTKKNAIDHLKAGQTRADHAKVEVSTSEGDACVYGVVAEFNGDEKLIVTSVGIGSVRVTGACAKGDLLESNGDGTAKVQSDDIVRSKTLGKVTIGNSNTGVKLVSCVMYCG